MKNGLKLTLSILVSGSIGFAGGAAITKNTANKRIEEVKAHLKAMRAHETIVTSSIEQASIAGRVRKIVAEQLAVQESKIQDNSSFVEDLGADSLDSVELVLAVEREFEIDIRDADAEKLVTFGDLTRYLSNRKMRANGNAGQQVTPADRPLAAPAAGGWVRTLNVLPISYRRRGD